jgi:hypothetical protein
MGGYFLLNCRVYAIRFLAELRSGFRNEYFVNRRFADLFEFS